MGKKVSGTADWLPTVLILGTVGVGGYLVWKYVLNGQSTATGQNNASIDQNSATSVQNDINNAQASGSKQTLSDSTLNGYATSLYQYLGQGGDPYIDMGSAIQVDNIISQVETDVDWYRLVQIFGTKKYNSGGSFNACALIGVGCDSYDLVGLLRAALPPENRANLNTYFSDQGINVQI